MFINVYSISLESGDYTVNTNVKVVLKNRRYHKLVPTDGNLGLFLVGVFLERLLRVGADCTPELWGVKRSWSLGSRPQSGEARISWISLPNSGASTLCTTVEFLPVGHSSRSLGASELFRKVPSTRSHTLETLETTQNLIWKLLRGFLGTRKSRKIESRN